MTDTFGLYARVSTTDQLDGMSIEAQIKSLRDWATAHGYSVREFIDAGKSAWTEDLRRRPAFLEMLDAARNHAINGIAVTHLDRFSRKVLVTLSVLGELGQLGVGFVSLENTGFDFTRPADRLMLTVLGGFAEYYSAELSRKIRRGLAQRASKGFSLGVLEYGYCKGACRECRDLNPPCPRFGKVSGIIAHPDDAPGVVLAYETYRQRGKSFDDIADVLNAAGFRSRTSHGRVLWNKYSVDELLCNISYTGIVSYNGQEIAGQHPALISRELFDEVQAIRRSRKSRQATHSKQYTVYLLNGILRCAGCNRPMRAQNHYRGTHRWLYYRCTTNSLRHGTCPHPGAWINEQDLVPQIAEIITQFNLPADWLAQVNDLLAANDKPKQDRDNRARLNERLARLKQQFEWGDIGQQEYIRKRDEIKSQLNRTRPPGAAQVVASANMLQSMAKVWTVATQEEKRDMLRAILDTVTCDPSTRRLVTLKPKEGFRLLFQQIGGLRAAGDVFQFKKL